MPSLPITQLRLRNQLINASKFNQPDEVVRWLGGVQAQDYPAAKWAVGQRMPGCTDMAIEQAFNAGAILRTHVLRPTWHFVTPDDIRWMLDLTSARIKIAMRYNNRRLELDQSILSAGNLVIEKALQGGNQLTRGELEPLLQQAGILFKEDDPLRFLHIVVNAELERIVCSGAHRGKQHTYALMEERAPNARVLEREEALAELALRYFTSRGPAMLKDYIWWSGLSSADAKAGLAMIKPRLIEEVVNGQSFWLNPVIFPAIPETTPAVHFLPNYDEYIVGYTDRSAIFDPAVIKKVDERGNFLFNHTILIDGQIAGTWKRIFRKGAVEIIPNLFIPLSESESQALAAEMCHYSEYLGMPRYSLIQ